MSESSEKVRVKIGDGKSRATKREIGETKYANCYDSGYRSQL